MKIISAEQIKQLDNQTIKIEPISSLELMERAALHLLHFMIDLPPVQSGPDKTCIFCGMGNNGGDGLAIARLMHEKKYNVEVFVVQHKKDASPEFQANEERLRKIKDIKIQYISGPEGFPELPEKIIIIDALLGNGIHSVVSGLLEQCIQFINRQNVPVISIDLPSGLFADKSSEMVNPKSIIRADYTLTIELPKLAFMFPENAKFLGNWKIVPIQLNKEFLSELPCSNYFLEKEDLKHLLKRRGKFSHKGSFGHALIIAGSKGKMGSAILAAEACLRTGAGLLSMYIPECGYVPMQTAVPEAMVITDSNSDCITERISGGFADAIGIGPGIGKRDETANALKLLIQECVVPLVLDADALNILSENKTWISFLPAGSILTPHPLEFERICGKSTDSFDRLEKQREFAMKHKLYVIVKGAHTSIAFPDGRCYFNSSGNPGMASAGSGDVLTGILTGLLASGYKRDEACLLGVYMHGLSGDMAANELGMEAMIARDIVRNIAKAFQHLIPILSLK